MDEHLQWANVGAGEGGGLYFFKTCFFLFLCVCEVFVWGYIKKKKKKEKKEKKKTQILFFILFVNCQL